MLPFGYTFAGVHCGLKRNKNKPDLTLVRSEVPAVAAGVYTQNLVFAAPVAVDRSRTPCDNVRVVVVNSGNANACTGERGMADALRMAELAAAACETAPEQALVMSTGIIGEFLPMEKIQKGITDASERLSRDETSFDAAARGILTTDTVKKVAARKLNLGGREIRLVGFAKGAAMIGPNMATMLGLLLTDAPLTVDSAQGMLSAVTDETFNCISVEGHTSTNDTVLLLANGRAGGEPLEGADEEAFAEALMDVCVELAKAIPSDGEGTEHLITITAAGLRTKDDARQIAKTVAESALVKTAVAGADPNWGRIVSAAGYSEVPFDTSRLSLHVNGTLLFDAGAPVSFDAHAVSKSIRENRETTIELQFQEGNEQVRFWTTDLTAEYVRLNADYHT